MNDPFNLQPKNNKDFLRLNIRSGFFTVCSSRLSAAAAEDLWTEEIMWNYQLWPFCQRFSFFQPSSVRWKNKPAWIKSNSPLFTNARWLDQIYLPDSSSKEDFVGVEFTCVHCHQKHRNLEISKQTSWGRKIRAQRCEDREQSRGLNRLNSACTREHSPPSYTPQRHNTAARNRPINQQLKWHKTLFG